MKVKGRFCSTLLPPTSAPLPHQHLSIWANGTSPGGISTPLCLRNNEEQTKSSEKHFLLGTGHAILGCGVPGCQQTPLRSLSAPGSVTQDSSATRVSPPGCLLPTPQSLAHGSMRAGTSWQPGSAQDTVSWQWLLAALSLLHHPCAPQRYLSSLMPAVAPR